MVFCFVQKCFFGQHESYIGGEHTNHYATDALKYVLY